MFDDRVKLEAHKIVLSAWSPVFRYMLANNPHTHPMIFLKGMSFQTVHSILEFLYKGEVRIARDSVEEFLSEAEDLQISQFLLDTTEVSGLRPDIGQNSLQTEAGQADHQIKLFRE